jgi:hypothetical protein
MSDSPYGLSLFLSIPFHKCFLIFAPWKHLISHCPLIYRVAFAFSAYFPEGDSFLFRELLHTPS